MTAARMRDVWEAYRKQYAGLAFDAYQQGQVGASAVLGAEAQRAKAVVSALTAAGDKT